MIPRFAFSPALSLLSGRKVFQARDRNAASPALRDLYRGVTMVLLNFRWGFHGGYDDTQAS